MSRVERAWRGCPRFVHGAGSPILKRLGKGWTTPRRPGLPSRSNTHSVRGDAEQRNKTCVAAGENRRYLLRLAPAAASSLGSRPWCVPNARSERPRASGEYAGIISIPSRAMNSAPSRSPTGRGEIIEAADRRFSHARPRGRFVPRSHPAVAARPAVAPVPRVEVPNVPALVTGPVPVHHPHHLVHRRRPVRRPRQPPVTQTLDPVLPVPNSPATSAGTPPAAAPPPPACRRSVHPNAVRTTSSAGPAHSTPLRHPKPEQVNRTLHLFLAPLYLFQQQLGRSMVDYPRCLGSNSCLHANTHSVRGDAEQRNKTCVAAGSRYLLRLAQQHRSTRAFEFGPKSFTDRSW